MHRTLVALAAILAISTGDWQLRSASSGVEITRERVGSIPVTLFRPTAGSPAPAVVIAHGFAGSQQLMQPFALTLSRNGYVAATFDFPGHARNPVPLASGLGDAGARTAALIDTLDQVIAHVRAAPYADGRIALLGHSMASDIVVRYARAHPDVESTVAVSFFSLGKDDVTATAPRNLLIIDGALEARALREEGYRIVGLAAGGPAREDVTYGSFADGTARRLALAEGVEHIGVLYSGESLGEALGWMNEAFGRRGDGFVDARGPWLALLYLGVVALAWALAGLLPRVAPTPIGSGYGWRRLLPVAVVPALATPLVLWKTPTDFLPILMGDYLTPHFALYGLMTAIGIRVAGRSRETPLVLPVSLPKFGVAALATTAYSTLAIGLPTDAFGTSLAPGIARLPLILALLCGTLPYCIADEWLTRSPAAPHGAYAATKLCFLGSLLLAIALNPPKLLFLVIIVPVILALFLVFGLVSGWAYRRTNVPVVGALANALVFAWAIAVTFPMVSR